MESFPYSKLNIEYKYKEDNNATPVWLRLLSGKADSSSHEADSLLLWLLLLLSKVGFVLLSSMLLPAFAPGNLLFDLLNLCLDLADLIFYSLSYFL
jgi:hypothetical protein